MPFFVKTQSDEKKWERAKASVAKQFDMAEKDFTIKQWAITTKIFKKMKKGK